MINKDNKLPEYYRLAQRRINSRKWYDETGRKYFFGGFDSNTNAVFFSYVIIDDRMTKSVIVISTEDALNRMNGKL